MKIFTGCLVLLLLTLFTAAAPKTINVYTSEKAPQVVFALDELEKALSKKEMSMITLPISSLNSKQAEYSVFIAREDNRQIKGKIRRGGELEKEGFRIVVSGKQIGVIAADDAGLMYGILELSEIIRTSGPQGVKETIQNPYMKIRGVKFNLPLDVRTPTYTDPSDAAQKNMAEMWNFGFWKEYIDSLAKFRYNLVSLWNLHPFPSMVKVPDYPDVALADVRRSTVQWKENYSLNGQHFDDPEIVNNYEVLYKMTIEEKIDFWRKVMAYGKERNVMFYIITWNIFDYGVEGKYGIDDNVDNPVTRDYFRKSVRQMLLTYPDLAGIGLTTGENMYGLSTAKKEEWAFDTYGKAVLDVAVMQPARQITFIHRQHQTGTPEIAAVFKPLTDQPNIDFVFSFKYAQAHVYSSINQPVESFVEDVRKGNGKTLWTLRNDDVYYFRWGAPDYIRSFIKNIPYDISEGFYLGSDQYVWGRDFLSRNTGNNPGTEIAKHWYHFMVWGRLGYNPALTDDRIVNLLSDHFPGINGKSLFTAWQNASMIYPLVTGFHWGYLDFHWYIEAGQSQPDQALTPTGYHDVNRFITLPPHPGTGYMSIPDYTEMVLSGKVRKGITPADVAEEILLKSDSALTITDNIKYTGNPELRYTINDIRSMAYLGKYYGHKIKAATSLHMFRNTLKPADLADAVNELRESALWWRYYSSTSLGIYKNPLWTNRVGYVDWKKNYSYVLYDITANGGSIDIPSMVRTPGGTVLEAEDGNFSFPSFSGNSLKGFSGKGYVDCNDIDAVQSVKLNYEAAEQGSYVLEIQYTLKRQQVFSTAININGQKTAPVDLWNSASEGTWVYDKVEVELSRGQNTIELFPPGAVVLDYVNVLKN
ncbi:MAG TPA: alpha-glucuronidase family glycosyl hydrolase [Bacteroidales bacterium]|nr:alpha-glucuronidase family glycosyl hydrolase [Bacteroidales bacterium]